MNWNYLKTLDQLKDLMEESNGQTILIFKHSTRCSTSRMVLDRLERNWDTEQPIVKPYFVDLLSYREISNAISNHFNVEHQSPQIILIRGGKSIFSRSHFEIDMRTISNAVKN